MDKLAHQTDKVCLQRRACKQGLDLGKLVAALEDYFVDEAGQTPEECLCRGGVDVELLADGAQDGLGEVGCVAVEEGLLEKAGDVVLARCFQEALEHRKVNVFHFVLFQLGFCDFCDF